MSTGERRGPGSGVESLLQRWWVRGDRWNLDGTRFEAADYERQLTLKGRDDSGRSIKALISLFAKPRTSSGPEEGT